MNLGPVMIDLKGLELDAEERELLSHPAVGGVLLFTRNYTEHEQLIQLVTEIHELRVPPLLVAVDHEGGVVQRFRHQFTVLPPPAAIGELYDREPNNALKLAGEVGWLIGVELRGVGIDFSFAPVLDIRSDASRIINRRAFHRDPEIVSRLATRMVAGLKEAGMAAVGKHFPGHGTVCEDSHHELPVDDRALVDLQFCDLIPFERLIHQQLPAIMPAHVCYPRVDELPASFSKIWLRRILREQMGFQGAIFSDDISMYGAQAIGDAKQRAVGAIAAGCDMVLVCNDREAAVDALEALSRRDDPAAHARLIRMHGRGEMGQADLSDNQRWRQAGRKLQALLDEPELDLGDDERF
jgi:beta-N-acetylhexosaminidase